MKERRCHWLRQNRKSKRPGAFLFVDVEARIEHIDERVQDHTFRLGVASFCVRDDKGRFREVQQRRLSQEAELWGWVEALSKTYAKLMIITHNVDYDARLLRAFWFLPHLGWKPKFCVVAPTCVIFEWARGEATVMLFDNLNLFRMSLADLGAKVGLQKMEVDFDTVADEELYAYCKRDVEILVKTWRWWLQFLDRHNLGNFGMTIGAQAMNAYTHRFMPCKIGIHPNGEALELEREAYRGGRVECYRVGKLPGGEYYKVDVNSLYPAMMKFNPYPRRKVKILLSVAPQYLDFLLQDYLAIAEVVIETEEPKYPLVVDKQTVFPTGVFKTVLSTPELEEALNCGEIRGVGRVVLYEPADLFSKYVDFCFEQRRLCKERRDWAGNKMFKDLVNSLTGKLGQHGYSQSVVRDAPIDAVGVQYFTDPETGDVCTEITFGGKVIRQQSEPESENSFPAIPAHINAYGRMYMWRLIKMAGREHVFYSDTDSLIVDAQGLDNLREKVDPGRLGYLKIEGVATEVEICAKKDYRFGDRTVIKGIRKSAVALGDGVFEQLHFARMRYGFQTQNLESVTVCTVRKELRRVIVAGNIGGDGWVSPLRLSLSLDELRALDPKWNDVRYRTWEFDLAWLRGLGGGGQVTQVFRGRVAWRPELSLRGA